MQNLNSYKFGPNNAGRFGIHKTNAFVGTTMTRGVASVILFSVILITGVEFPPLGVHYLWVMIAGICLPGLFSLLLLMVNITPL